MRRRFGGAGNAVVVVSLPMGEVGEARFHQALRENSSHAGTQRGRIIWVSTIRQQADSYTAEGVTRTHDRPDIAGVLGGIKSHPVIPVRQPDLVQRLPVLAHDSANALWTIFDRDTSEDIRRYLNARGATLLLCSYDLLPELAFQQFRSDH